MEEKRKRGRPRKYPLPEPPAGIDAYQVAPLGGYPKPETPTVYSIGVEITEEGGKKIYKAFTERRQNGQIIERVERQKDIKQSSCDELLSLFQIFLNKIYEGNV
jgi:hypothetical protein